MGSLVALFILVAALAGCDEETPPAALGTLEITAVAGPVCPVEREPPDPACAPRAVVGAEIVVTAGDAQNLVVAQGTTDAQGILVLQVSAGDHVVRAGPFDGLFAPEPMTVSVAAGETTSVVVSYDTGIR